MISLPVGARILLATRPVDFRKGVNGPPKLPGSGPVKFPTGWASVISRRVDRRLPGFLVGGRAAGAVVLVAAG
jgi:hypothetical protein